MTDALEHRGPDDHAYAIVGPSHAIEWRDDEPNTVVTSGVAMGHRRLSILDLSPAGRQPFCSNDRRYWMIYNGEVYNYVELRHELKMRGHSFRSATDTEVILAAYQEWGEQCLNRFNGMWALLIWDSLAQSLFIARDRVGIKPLHYAQVGEQWIFASEVKALLQHPGIEPVADMGGVLRFLWTEDIPDQGHTFFSGIRSIPAGHCGELRGSNWHLRRYWDIPGTTKTGGTLGERAEELRELLTDSVRLQLRSDVPVGTMLSGGLDSTSIATAINALLKSQRHEAESVGHRQRAISSCYPGMWNDETAKIDELARRLDIDVDKVYPRDADVSARLTEVVIAVEQPFAGTMPVVQDLMMREARSIGINVTLNGHGPDEMFAGYPARHCSFVAAHYLRRGRLYRCTLELIGMKRLHDVGMRDFAYTLLRIQLPFLAMWLRRTVKAGDRRFFRRDALRAYAGMPSRFSDASSSGKTPLDRRLRREFSSEIVPRYLAYEDGVSMASSVEARVPFLDHRLVEFAFSLDDTDKILGGVTKHILRVAASGILPANIVEDYRKIYVEAPSHQWLRGCLRRTLTELFLEDDALIAEVMDPDHYRPLVREFLNGANHRGWELDLIWRMLTAEVWLRCFFDGPTPRSTDYRIPESKRVSA